MRRWHVAQQTTIWDHVNAHARSIIFLNCTPIVINHVKHMKVAHGIWQHLAFLYDRVMPMKRVALEFQLCELDP